MKYVFCSIHFFHTSYGFKIIKQKGANTPELSGLRYAYILEIVYLTNNMFPNSRENY
jgi:hypothetical protein